MSQQLTLLTEVWPDSSWPTTPRLTLCTRSSVGYITAKHNITRKYVMYWDCGGSLEMNISQTVRETYVSVSNKARWQSVYCVLFVPR